MKTIAISFKRINITIRYIVLLFFTTCIFQASILAQERKLIYDVIRNGNIIGKIIFLELTKDQKKFLSLTSDVKTRFIFSFSDCSTENATYKDSVMIYSSFYKKQNGSDKANKITIACGKFYKLIDDGVSKLISCDPIRYNMLLLYTAIPASTTKVYSDNFQKLLDLKKVGENKYRLSLPDGNYNYYTYKNGVCNRVDIERTFFSVQFVLKDR